ncbi:MAG: hypothetical protein AAF502_19455 [Bacteroidota bacterium]
MRKKFDSMEDIAKLKYTTYKSKLNDYIARLDVTETVEVNFFTILEFQYADKVKPVLFFDLGPEHKKFIKSKGLKRGQRDCGFGTAKISEGSSPEKRLITLEVKRGKVRNSEIKKKFRSSKLIETKHTVSLEGDGKHLAPELKASSGTFGKDTIFKSLKSLQEEYNALHDLDFEDRAKLLKQITKQIDEWNTKNPDPEGSGKKSDSKDKAARRREVGELAKFVAREDADLDGDKAEAVLKELLDDNKIYKGYKEDHPAPSDKHINYLNDMLRDIDKYRSSDPNLGDSQVRKYLGQMEVAEKKILEERKSIMSDLIDGKSKSMIMIHSVKALKKLEPTAKAEKEAMDKIIAEFNKDRDPKLTAKQILKKPELLEELADLGFERELDEAITYVSGSGTGRDNLAFGFRANSSSTAITSVLLNSTGRKYLTDDVMPLMYDSMAGDNPTDHRNDSFTKEFLFTPEEINAIEKTYQNLIDYFKTPGALTKCPDSFKRVAYKAALKAAKKGAHPNGILVYLGGSLFLRFMNPLIAVMGRTQLSHSTYIISEILLRQANQVRFEGSKAKGLDVFNGVLKDNEGVLEDFLLKVAAAGAPDPTSPKILMQALYSEQLKSMEVESEGLALQVESFNSLTKKEEEIEAFYKTYGNILSLEEHLNTHYSNNEIYEKLSNTITTGTKTAANKKIVKNLQAITADLKQAFIDFMPGTKEQSELKAFKKLYGRYEAINRKLLIGLHGEKNVPGLEKIYSEFMNALEIGEARLKKIGHSWKTAAQMKDYRGFNKAEQALGKRLGDPGLRIPGIIKSEILEWWQECGGFVSQGENDQAPRELVCWILFQYSAPFYRLSFVHNVDSGAKNMILPKEMEN